ncbi:MAG: GTPase RsgA, partial [Mesorhizobium sp.]
MAKAMTDHSAATRSMSLASLGWTDFFGDQLGPHEASLVPMRIAAVHRDRLTGISQTGQMDLTLP